MDQAWPQVAQRSAALHDAMIDQVKTAVFRRASIEDAKEEMLLPS